MSLGFTVRPFRFLKFLPVVPLLLFLVVQSRARQGWLRADQRRAGQALAMVVPSPGLGRLQLAAASPCQQAAVMDMASRQQATMVEGGATRA